MPLPDKGAGGAPLSDNRYPDNRGMRLYRIIGACAFKVYSSVQYSKKKLPNPLIGACAYMRGIRVMIIQKDY